MSHADARSDAAPARGVDSASEQRPSSRDRAPAPAQKKSQKTNRNESGEDYASLKSRNERTGSHRAEARSERGSRDDPRTAAALSQREPDGSFGTWLFPADARNETAAGVIDSAVKPSSQTKGQRANRTASPRRSDVGDGYAWHDDSWSARSFGDERRTNRRSHGDERAWGERRNDRGFGDDRRAASGRAYARDAAAPARDGSFPAKGFWDWWR